MKITKLKYFIHKVNYQVKNKAKCLLDAVGLTESTRFILKSILKSTDDICTPGSSTGAWLTTRRSISTPSPTQPSTPSYQIGRQGKGFKIELFFSFELKLIVFRCSAKEWEAKKLLTNYESSDSS